MKPLEIAENIFWVGAIDWNIRDFHGYSTKEGTTYNAFLIRDEKTALIDTVKGPFADELLTRVSHIMDPSEIDLVISNHAEPDHSGGLPRIMHRIGEDKPLYCSKNGMKSLTAIFGDRWDIKAVEDGGELCLGARTLTFLETRMLHWPDSMFSYCMPDKILFSSDGFGQHYASHERFDDEVGHKIMPHAAKYYANILLPFSPLITKLVKKVTDMGLEFDMVCPDHGILWREDPGKIITAYAQWAEQKPQKKAVVVFDTMWHSTEKMAAAVAEGLNDQGIETQPVSIRGSHRSDIITKVMNSGVVAVGSPTLNNGLFPTVADVLTYMKGLKPKNKIGGAFGSFGWSGEAPGLILKQLEEMGFEIPAEALRIMHVPTEAGLESAYELGTGLGKALVEKLEK